MYLIVMYLAAIVAANLTTAAFGPGMSVINALLFIGLDLTARDRLHEQWSGRDLWRNMALLIGAGSILSAALNWNAASIAVASFAAFAAAGVVDTVVYAAMGSRARLVKINGSNIASAAVDSVVFPALAFGLPLLVPIMVGQFAAKTIGGAVWSVVLHNKNLDLSEQGGS